MSNRLIIIFSSFVISTAIAVMVTMFFSVGGFSDKRADDYVTFDTAKYIASRTEMTSRLLGNNATVKQEAVSVLARVEKSTMEVLKKYANNRVVIVKQAMVLDGQVPDITDAVLNELGLPVSVASVQPQAPDRVLSNFALSDDYIHGSEIHKRVAEEVARQNDEKFRAFEDHKKEQQEKRVQSFLP